MYVLYKVSDKTTVMWPIFQKWFSDLDNSTREFYKDVKKDFKFEEYLIRLSRQDQI